MTLATPLLDIRPQSGWTGAEIHGVDLTAPLADEQIAAIREALLTWKVVFFRDQFISHDDHLRFARAFGGPTPAHPLFDSIPDPNYPTIYPIFRDRFKARFRGNGYDKPNWHADVTAAVNPPAASILRAEVIPPYGGDTQFTNLAVAYDQLSPEVQQFIGGLHAVHHNVLPLSRGEMPSGLASKFASSDLRAVHPVVRVHPETGEKVIFVNPNFTSHIVELSRQEGRHVLAMLYEHMTNPSFTVRFRWQPGSIAFWDNRATAHLVPTDVPAEFERTMQRITIAGDVPVGPDGSTSYALAGDTFS